MTSKINILFPVETINRELDFRLMLACRYVNPRNRIFIGQHDVIYQLLKHMKGGIYVGKNIFRSLFSTPDLTRYQILKDRGFTLVHLDEEGGIFPGREEDWRSTLRLRLDPKCLKKNDYICTWGDFQADFYRSQQPDCFENIRTTGHPRFDLCRTYTDYYRDAVGEIESRFGQFFLINTNLSFANNRLGLTNTFSIGCGYDPKSLESRQWHIDVWANAAHNLARFVKLVSYLSIKFPSNNFVIRPHPGEDQDFYKNIFNGVENVHIVHEGNVTPWLLACRAMVHDGCTTSIEAYMAGANIVNYGMPNAPRSYYLPSLFGKHCASEEEVGDCISKVLDGGSLDAKPSLGERATNLLHNFQNDSFAALTRVLQEAEAVQYDFPNTFDERGFSLQSKVKRVTDTAKGIVRPMFPNKLANFNRMKGFFYGFDEPGINRKIKAIQNLLSKNVNAVFHSDTLISIEIYKTKVDRTIESC